MMTAAGILLPLLEPCYLSLSKLSHTHGVRVQHCTGGTPKHALCSLITQEWPESHQLHAVIGCVLGSKNLAHHMLELVPADSSIGTLASPSNSKHTAGTLVESCNSVPKEQP